MFDTSIPVESAVLGACRRLAKLTEAELADLVGDAADKTLSVYESGTRTPSPEILYKYLKPLGYSEAVVDFLVFAFRLATALLPVPESPRAPSLREKRRVRELVLHLGGTLLPALEAFLDGEVEGVRWERQRRQAAELWTELAGRPAAEQETRVETDGELHTAALCERLCRESVEAAPDKPARALRLARLALAVAERVPGPEAWGQTYAGLAWGFIGNAHRVQGDLHDADAAFARARADLQEGTALAEVGWLAAWRLDDLEASLRRDQERFDEALELLDRALSACPDEAVGRILVKKAATLEDRGDVEKAVAALREAAPLVDVARDPRLRCCLVYNLAVNLVHLERFAEAGDLVPEVRELAIRLRKEYDLIRVRWIEARIDAGCGRLEEAAVALRQVRRDFLARGNPLDTALATLNLALVLLDLGRSGEVRELAPAMLATFRTLQVERDTLAALMLFCEAAEREAATAEVARQLFTRLEALGRKADLLREARREEASSHSPGGSNPLVGGLVRQATAVRVHTAPRVELESRSGAAVGVGPAALVEVEGRGGALAGGAAVGIHAASRVQGGPEAGEKLGDHGEGERRPLGARPLGRGDGLAPQDTARDQENRNQTTAGGHTTAPFAGATGPGRPLPGGTPGEKSTGGASGVAFLAQGVDEAPETFSEDSVLVRWARGFADLTQEGLAEAAGVSKAAVCRYEKGASVRRKTLSRLAMAVRLPLSFVEACWRPAVRAARALARGLVPTRSFSNPRVRARAVGELVEELLVSAVTSLEVETEAALPTVEELLGLLLRQPRERRLPLLEADADFNTWLLAVRLCDESVAAAGHSPKDARHLAELALALARRVKGSRAWKVRLAGFCQVFLANALRVAGDLDAAEAAFALAWRLWDEGAGGDAAGLLAGWRLLDLEASLRRDQERFADALERVETALSACPRSVTGRILVKKASILEAAGEREQAVATLQAADPLVDGEKDVRLRTCLLFNLAINLCHLERTEEAAVFLSEIRRLNERMQNRYDAARHRWLEGTVAAGRGLGDEARAALEEVRAEFRRLGNEHEVALVSLELARLYLEAGGRTAEVREIAREVCPYFTRLGLPRSTAAAVELFCAAAEQEVATAAMVRQLLARLGRRA